MRRRTVCVTALVVLSATGLSIGLPACVGEDATVTPGARDASTTEEGSAAIDGGLGADGSGGDLCAAPLSECSGKCVNLDTSSDDCGACGHSCLGGTCASGKCAPIKLTGGLNAPSALALAASPPLVIVAADTALYKCAKSGCTSAERMWSATTYPPRGDVISVAISGGEAFSATDTPGNGVRVSRVSLSATTTTPAPLSTTAVGVGTVSLAFDGTRLVVGGGPSIRTCLTSGCGGYQDLLSSIYLGSATLTADPGGVYVFGGGTFGTDGVSTCARSASLPCTPQPLVTRAKSGSAYFLQVVAGTAYWVDIPDAGKHRVLACKLSGCNDAPTVIAEDEEDIGGLAVDAKGAYFTTTLANVVRVCSDLVGGCGKTATSLVVGQTKPVGIALDGEAIYWVNQGGAPNTGEIMKLAR